MQPVKILAMTTIMVVAALMGGCAWINFPSTGVAYYPAPACAGRRILLPNASGLRQPGYDANGYDNDFGAPDWDNGSVDDDDGFGPACPSP
jgi:hypothetical protein